jgi:hypothetical protein
MLEELRLERFVASRRENVLCAICDRHFTPQQIAELLYAGAFPVGFLCPECFASPRQAADCARNRASTIRTLAKEARDSVSRPEWLTLLHLAHSRASYWEGLAARIENLNTGDWKNTAHEPAESCAVHTEEVRHGNSLFLVDLSQPLLKPARRSPATT